MLRVNHTNTPKIMHFLKELSRVKYVEKTHFVQQQIEPSVTTPTTL